MVHYSSLMIISNMSNTTTQIFEITSIHSLFLTYSLGLVFLFVDYRQSYFFG